MKTTFILLLALSSLNLFAAELGEDKKSECAFINQTDKREAKVVSEQITKEEKKDEPQTRSK